MLSWVSWRSANIFTGLTPFNLAATNTILFNEETFFCCCCDCYREKVEAKWEILRDTPSQTWHHCKRWRWIHPVRQHTMASSGQQQGINSGRDGGKAWHQIVRLNRVGGGTHLESMWTGERGDGGADPNTGVVCHIPLQSKWCEIHAGLQWPSGPVPQGVLGGLSPSVCIFCPLCSNFMYL